MADFFIVPLLTVMMKTHIYKAQFCNSHFSLSIKGRDIDLKEAYWKISMSFV